jgi:hypothetical protein
MKNLENNPFTENLITHPISMCVILESSRKFYMKVYAHV